jgi:hypothetical protein
MKKRSYNLRLFSGWRAVHHYRRFYWIRDKLRSLNLKKRSIIELGCHDGKIINFFEEPPKEYLGLDANWENGLNIARDVYDEKKFASFQICQSPEDIPTERKYDIGISMETFEHIPNYLIDNYLLILSKIIKERFYITLPIERGIAFILASLTRIPKGLFSRYTMKEILWSFLGRLDKIKRIKGHKGFDDRIFIKKLRKKFHILENRRNFS